MKQLLIVFYADCFKFALKKWADTLIFRVKVFGIAIAKRRKKLRYASILLLTKQEVKMVWHKGITQNSNLERLRYERGYIDTFCFRRKLFVMRIPKARLLVPVVPNHLLCPFIVPRSGKNWSFFYTPIVKMIYLTCCKNNLSHRRHTPILSCHTIMSRTRVNVLHPPGVAFSFST